MTEIIATAFGDEKAREAEDLGIEDFRPQTDIAAMSCARAEVIRGQKFIRCTCHEAEGGTQNH